MTTIEMAGADVPAAAATTDTDHAALLMTVIADDLRVLEALVDGCVEEEEAGVARMTDTGRGLGESPEGDPDHAPNLHLHEKTSTQHRLPITPRKRCDGHTPHPAPGPGPYQDHAPVHVLGPDPGLVASPEVARKLSEPTPLVLSVILSDGPEMVICQEKICLF